MRTKKEWKKLSKDIKEEDFNLRLEEPLRKLKHGVPLSESDFTILYECFDALIEKVAMLKVKNTLYEGKTKVKVAFERAVKPVMKYLAENHHPHTKIIIDSNIAELVEGIKTVVTDEFIVD